MTFAKTNFCLEEEKQQQQRLEDVISNLDQNKPYFVSFSKKWLLKEI